MDCSDPTSVISRGFAGGRGVTECAQARRAWHRDCRVGRYTRAMNAVRALTLALTCVLPLSALAQWQWIDKSGRRVYSDQAPPPEVPAKNILKGSNGRTIAPPPETSAAVAAPAATPAASAPKVVGRDKELEARKKQAEAAEAEKKKAQEREVAEARTENCKRAREAKATLDSGIRLSRVNDKGEREILDDAQRAAEGQRLQVIITRDCAS